LPSDLVYTADITGLATTGDLANKLDTTAFSTVSSTFLTAHQDISNLMPKSESANFYPTSNPSGFISEIPDELNLTALYIEGEIGPGQSEKEGVAITQTGISLYNELYGDVNIDKNAIEKWDDTNNVLTANSAAWNEVSAKQASGNYYSASNPSGFISEVPDTYLQNSDLGITDNKVTAISGILLSAGDELPESVSAATDCVTANSATWNSVTNKLDTTAFSDVSGNFLTAHQDLSDYQPISGMTAYLKTGDSANFYTTANESGFITGVDLTPYQTTAGMTAYQPAGDYLTTADSAQFITALPADLVYTADITGFATTADLTSKLDKSDSAKFYTTANESGFITGIPDEVTDAASTVASNSANWNSTYNTVTANSADWSVSEEISGTNGIKISESADKVIIEVSASYATEDWVTGQGYITGINYNTGSI
jgi:hypothetical protein